MMSNPESMKNMNPEDLKQAAEQLKHTRPENTAEIGENMAKASPEDITAMRAHADAQMLKKQGNDLYSRGNFTEAAEKYSRAKNNLKDIPSSKGGALLLACSLNLMSCYLKTNQHEECIKDGSEILAYDARNVEALYRRGQAYRDLGMFEDAVSDLSKAHEVSPEDETIADGLRDVKERLAVNSTEKKKASKEVTGTQRESNGAGGGLKTDVDGLQALKDNPEAIRTFQNFISRTDPDTLAALSGGKAGEMSPDMFKTASSILCKFSPKEIQKMVQTASSFKGDNPFTNTTPSAENGFTPTPGMLKLASDMMSNESLLLIKQGAEARVFESTFVGRRSIVKERFSKKYRHPILDSKLTLKRLNAEARCMTKARKLGVCTPALYAMDPLLHSLTLEYIEGVSVKDIFLDFGANGIVEERLDDVAAAIAKLHDGGLAHGDLTTSNMLVRSGTNQLVVIDFGLSFTSTLPEDKAVDLYVLERALLSMHSSCGNVMDRILTAYRKTSKQWSATFNKLAQVRQRGRKRTMIG